MDAKIGAISMRDEMMREVRQLNERIGYSLPDDFLDMVANTCHLVQLPKKRMLFHRGELPAYFYRVAKGCVQLHSTPPDGSERKVIALLRDAESICHEAAFLGEAYPVSAETVTDCRILACPRSFILDMLEVYPSMSRQMLHNLSRQTLTLTRRMGDLSIKSGAARLASYLMEQQPSLPCNAFEVTLAASKNSIASLLNLSPATLSRILTELKASGLIEVHGRVITILDRERLECLRAFKGPGGVADEVQR